MLVSRSSHKIHETEENFFSSFSLCSFIFFVCSLSVPLSVFGWPTTIFSRFSILIFSARNCSSSVVLTVWYGLAKVAVGSEIAVPVHTSPMSKAKIFIGFSFVTKSSILTTIPFLLFNHITWGKRMNVLMFLNRALDLFLGWPLIIYIAVISIICTISLSFVQLRYFFKAWTFTLFPEKAKATKADKKADMTPFQAFVNALNSSLGSGTIAGVATAIYMGGPGSAFWLVVTTFFVLAIRYCEVFLSAYFGARATSKVTIGGPMLYLKQVVGGKTLAYLYAFFAFLFGLIGGNAIQANTVGVSLNTTWSVSLYAVAVGMLLFVLYILLGGAARIVKVADFIVPVKVAVFFITTISVIIYHYQNIIPALKIIFESAFSSRAVAGAAVGFAIQKAIQYGMDRAIFATEAGLGTAAILFGSTGSKEPVRSGIMSMLAVVISTLACFLMSVCIVASGAWTSGLDSTALTIASYNTVFGWFGGWIVSFLSVSFAIGVLVTFAYITREAWLYLTGGRFVWMHAVLYSGVAVWGALEKVQFVWKMSSFAMAGMLLLNLFGILYLLPLIKKELRKFKRG